MGASERRRQPARYSLRWRLPLLISSLVVVVLVTFLWAAYREVEHNLLEAAAARALGAADQLAGLLAQSTQQRLADVRRTAANAAVRACVQHRTDEACQAARTSVAALASAGPQIIEIWNDGGERVVSAAFPPTAERALPPGSAPAVAGVGALKVSGDTIFAETVEEIHADGVSSDRPGPTRLGFLVVRRPVVANPTGDILNRLVGGGAAVVIGNRAGDVWTNLSTRAPAPPVNLTRLGVAEYRAADGERHIGALSEIARTPWAVWVEFPHGVVVAPAAAFLRRMLIFGILFLATSSFLAWWMSARITTPLHELTSASEAFAAGQYSRRVIANRHDEVGRLGAAFNAMAERIQTVNQELEERVQQRTEELDRFFSLSLDMLCIAAVDGRFQRLNPAWQDALGWTADELTSAPYVDFVHPDDVASTMAESAKLADGLTTVNFENRYRCKDGSYRWLNWKAAALPARGVVYAAARDVTDEKRIARELHDRVAELDAVNRELEAFSYSVSHDLRAPLRHISGFAALLDQSAADVLGPDGRRHLQTIIGAATRMGRLIDDLLAFSRTGRASLVRSRVDLAELVRDAQQEVAAAVNGRQVVWRVRDLPTAEVDAKLMRLVFVNLLSNALKYTSTRDRAEIDVGAASGDGGEIVVFVKDNGVGFDMQYASKLFGVFQRLHSADDFEGTGIGLANVRRIVQRHGGRTWAEGAIDRGATFYFSLPQSETGGGSRHV